MACDRKIAPHPIKKIAAAFKCRVYSKLMERREKNKMVARFKVSNNHEADALASALRAYASISSKLRQIKRQEKDKFEEKIAKRLLGK